MIEMQVGKEYIGDVISTNPVFLQRFEQVVCAFRFEMGTKFVVLLVTDAGIDQDVAVRRLNEQCPHRPGA